MPIHTTGSPAPALPVSPSPPSPAHRSAAPANQKSRHRESYTSHTARELPCDLRLLALRRFHRTLSHLPTDSPRARPSPPNSPVALIPTPDSSQLWLHSPSPHGALRVAKTLTLPAS